jgi:hypothetical protein
LEGLLENGIWFIQLTKKHIFHVGGGGAFKYKAKKKNLGFWSPIAIHFMFYPGQGPLVGDISEMTQPTTSSPLLQKCPHLAFLD